MQLTREQRHALQSYRAYHQAGRPLWSRFARAMMLRAPLFAAIVAAGIGLIAWTTDATTTYALALLFVGSWLGTISDDTAHFLMTVRLWPVLDQVITWERVDELLDGSR